MALSSSIGSYAQSTNLERDSLAVSSLHPNVIEIGLDGLAKGMPAEGEKHTTMLCPRGPPLCCPWSWLLLLCCTWRPLPRKNHDKLKGGWRWVVILLLLWKWERKGVGVLLLTPEMY